MVESEMTSQTMGYPPPAGYVQMPPSQPYMEGNRVEWSSGLCDCGNDCGRFCLTYFCPFVTFAQTAEIVDEGSNTCLVHGAIYVVVCLVLGVPCLYSAWWRGKIKSKYGIAGSTGYCGDCCIHYCCEPCALHQEFRELQHHGFKPSLGWKGNQRPQTHGPMAAPTPGAMKR